MISIIQIYENETGNKMPTNYLGFLEWHKDYIKWLELSLSILIFCNDQKKLSEQTPVEWLINKLQKSIHYQRVINEVNQSSTDVTDVIKQAKQMERLQHRVADN